MRCPACGEGRLYDGVLDIKESCNHCGFALKDHDHGDGAAYFVIITLTTLIMTLAVVVDLTYEPPVWIHLVLWGPLIIAGSIILLRIVKSVLIALQYKHKVLGFGKNE